MCSVANILLLLCNRMVNFLIYCFSLEFTLVNSWFKSISHNLQFGLNIRRNFTKFLLKAKFFFEFFWNGGTKCFIFCSEIHLSCQVLLHVISLLLLLYLAKGVQKTLRVKLTKVTKKSRRKWRSINFLVNWVSKHHFLFWLSQTRWK